MSPTDITSTQVAQINLVYRAYLDTIYKIDYYREKHITLVARSKHIDFLIALGAAASGGSGLAILASPEFAWLCAPVTTISTVGAIAKANYDWTGRVQKYFEMIEFYTPIMYRFKHVVEDIRTSQTWKQHFEDRFKTLRDDLSNAPIESSKDLPTEKKLQIQDQVYSRIKYKDWWAWKDNSS